MECSSAKHTDRRGYREVQKSSQDDVIHKCYTVQEESIHVHVKKLLERCCTEIVERLREAALYKKHYYYYYYYYYTTHKLFSLFKMLSTS